MLLALDMKKIESTLGNISTWLDYAEQFSFESDGESQNEFFEKNCTLSMEGCCLYRFIKTVNVSNFYDNGGGCVYQSNDMVRDFHFHLSDSKMQNAAMTTAHFYTLLARMFEKKL